MSLFAVPQHPSSLARERQLLSWFLIWQHFRCFWSVTVESHPARWKGSGIHCVSEEIAWLFCFLFISLLHPTVKIISLQVQRLTQIRVFGRNFFNVLEVIGGKSLIIIEFVGLSWFKMWFVDCEFIGAFFEIDGAFEWICLLIGGWKDGKLILHRRLRN